MLPENNSNWQVPLEYPNGFRTELADGRKRLVTALDAGGRERAPALAARAQVRYDCWVEQMERDWQIGSKGTCRSEFLAALGELEGVPKVAAAARGYNVFFDFDLSMLTPEGRQIVNAAAAAAHDDGTVQITLVGKADLSGTDPYNMSLSERRADTVRNTLLPKVSRPIVSARAGWATASRRCRPRAASASRATGWSKLRSTKPDPQPKDGRHRRGRAAHRCSDASLGTR